MTQLENETNIKIFKKIFYCKLNKINQVKELHCLKYSLINHNDEIESI